MTRITDPDLDPEFQIEFTDHIIRWDETTNGATVNGVTISDLRRFLQETWDENWTHVIVQYKYEPKKVNWKQEGF